MNHIEEAMTAHWGERCDDYEQGCPVCDAWRQYDNLVTDNRVTNNLFMEEMALRNAPPLDPSIRMAISKLIVEGKIHDLDNKTK
jgi:hypothetical protein